MDKLLTALFAALPPWRRRAINQLMAALIAMLVVAHRITGDQAAAVTAFWAAAVHLVWLLLCAMTDRTGPTPPWRQALYATLAAAFGVATAWQAITDAQAQVWLPLVADLAAAGLALIWTDPSSGSPSTGPTPTGLAPGTPGKRLATWHPSDGPTGATDAE